MPDACVVSRIEGSGIQAVYVAAMPASFWTVTVCSYPDLHDILYPHASMQNPASIFDWPLTVVSNIHSLLVSTVSSAHVYPSLNFFPLFLNSLFCFHFLLSPFLSLCCLSSHTLQSQLSLPCSSVHSLALLSLFSPPISLFSPPFSPLSACLCPRGRRPQLG